MKLTTEKLKKLILSEMKSYDIVSETEVDGFAEPEDEDRMAGRMELDLENSLKKLRDSADFSNHGEVLMAINTILDFLAESDDPDA